MPTRLYFRSASADSQMGYFTSNPLNPDFATASYFWRTFQLSPTSGSTTATIVRSTELGPVTYPLEFRVNPDIYYEWLSPPVDRVSSSRYVMIPQLAYVGDMRRGGVAMFAADDATVRLFVNKNATRAYKLDPFGVVGLGASYILIYTSSYDGMMNDNFSTPSPFYAYDFDKGFSVSQTVPNYGYSFAISKNENVIIVGSDTIDPETGQETVRVLYAPDYTQQILLTSSVTVGPSATKFGWGAGNTIACSADGSKIFVGEPAAPSASYNDVGVVNFYTGSNFNIVRTITASFDMFSTESINFAGFGEDVACSQDGNILAVGAIGISSSYGQVYIYSGSNYSLVKILSSSANEAVDLTYSFGTPIKMSDNGDIIAIGDYKNNRVHVYSGSNWQFRKILTASVSSSYSGLVLQEIPEDFGYSLECSSDGKTILVGSPNATVEDPSIEGSPIVYSGRVHLFTGSNWSTATVFTSSTAQDLSSFFGNRITLAKDTLDEIHIGGGGTYVHTLTRRGWIDDTVQLNICANQSANGANSTIGVRLDVLNTLLSENLYLTPYTKFPTELGNTNAKRIFTSSVRQDDGIFGTVQTPAPVFLQRGQRIRAQLGIMDAPAQTMPNGQTTTFTFNGSTATTDSNIFFSESITFMTTSSSPSVLYMTSVEDEAYQAPVSDILVTSVTPVFPLTSSNATSSVRQFGHALATSDDGNLLVAGAYLASALSGAAYVYQSSSLTNIRNPQRMQFVKELKASDSQSRHRDYFGYSIDVAKDKSTIVVGAPNAIVQNTSGSGKLYVYSGSNWNVEQIITSSNIIVSGNFGHSVRCSQDGNIIVVGAPNEVNPTSTGSVYVISGSSRNVIVKLTGSTNTEINSLFGNSLAMSYDGSTIVVGAPSESFTTQSQGAVYIYTGSNWQTRYLITESVSDRDRYFGYSVACSSDGTFIFVGAPGNIEDTGPTFTGNVYLYKDINWSSGSRVLPVGTPYQDGILLTRFGHKVSCTADGLNLYTTGKYSGVVTFAYLFKDPFGIGDLETFYSASYDITRPVNFFNVGEPYTGLPGVSYAWFNPNASPSDFNSGSWIGADIACASGGLPVFMGLPQNPINPQPYKEWVFPYQRTPDSSQAYVNILSASRA